MLRTKSLEFHKLSPRRIFLIEGLILRNAVTKDLLRSFLASLVRMRGANVENIQPLIYYNNFYNNTPRYSVNKIVDKIYGVFYEP